MVARFARPSRFKITARFTNGRISGNAAVNAYGGQYRAGADGTFSIGDLSVGAVGAIGPDGRAENAYLSRLSEARSFQQSGGVLKLFDRHGNESLVFLATRP